MGTVLRVSARNARFQQLQALLGNRAKRQRAGEFLVQGVRPITLAAEHGWRFRALAYDAQRPLSVWARDLLRRAGAEQLAMTPELLAELGEKDEGSPELLAVVEMPPDDLGRITVTSGFLGVVLDRPASPGNVGSIIRSADAFGADGVIVTGHAADVYDPKSVRASTGSLFALPVVRCPSHREVTAWLAAQRAEGCPAVLAGTDEHGEKDVFATDLTRPMLLVVGNETTGLSKVWQEACDLTVKIPMTGAASSLNAANAASVVLRDRQAAPRGPRLARFAPAEGRADAVAGECDPAAAGPVLRHGQVLRQKVQFGVGSGEGAHDGGVGSLRHRVRHATVPEFSRASGDVRPVRADPDGGGGRGAAGDEEIRHLALPQRSEGG